MRREATRDGRDLDLSPKEFTVLQILLEADGGTVSAEELLERAWDIHADPFTEYGEIEKRPQIEDAVVPRPRAFQLPRLAAVGFDLPRNARA